MARRAATATLLLATVGWPAQAEVYNLDGMPVPGPHSMSIYHVFYVHGPREKPRSATRAQATVEFRELAAFKKSGGSEPPRNYDSVELSILRWETFWFQLDKERFCASQKASEAFKHLPGAGTTPDETGVWIQRVPFPASGGPESQTVVFPIKRTGRYILTFTNCGNFSEATVSGSIAVRSAHGYLPPYEFSAMRVVGYFVVIYAIICMVWLLTMLRYFQALIPIQRGIGVIACICLLEALFEFVDHQAWNATGVRSATLFCLSVLCYTLKYTYSLKLLILEPLGARPLTSVLQIALVTVQGCLWKALLAIRFSRALSSRVLLAGTLPGLGVYLGLLIWTCAALSRFLRSRRKKKQDDLAEIFTEVRLVLAALTALSVVTATVQVVDLWRGPLLSWRLAWLPIEGAPQLIFMLALVAMMVVWCPAKESLKDVVQSNTTMDDETGCTASGLEEYDVDGGLVTGGSGRKIRAVEAEAIGVVAAEAKDADNDAMLL